MIKVIYNKTCGRCVQSEPLTSGMVGQPIELEYSADFDGLTLTAVFTNGKTTVDVLNPGNQCVIPHEVLDTVGTLVKVGIYAVRGNELVIPTVYATIGVVLKGADPSGDVSADPTLPVWAQIQGIIGNLNDLDTEAKNNLVAAINEAAQSGGGGGSASIAMRVDGGYIQYSTDNGKTWVNLIAEADLKGDKGDKGDKGADGANGAAGKSAYQYAVEGGYTGTETEFAKKLASGAMVVTITDNNGTLSADKSYIEIRDAIHAGIPVYIWYDGYGYPVIAVTADALSFGTIMCTNDDYGAFVATVIIEITPNGEVNDISAQVDIPTTLPNPNALTFTGAVTGSYDGSAPMTVNIPEGGGGTGVGGQSNLITRYVHSSNKKIYPTALNLETGVFTCENHGLTMGDAAIVVCDYWFSFMPYELIMTKRESISHPKIRVVDGNTFTLQYDNADITYTSSLNTNVDVTKWHIEISNPGPIEFTGFSAKSLEVRVSGWVWGTENFNLAVYPMVDGNQLLALNGSSNYGKLGCDNKSTVCVFVSGTIYLNNEFECNSYVVMPPANDADYTYGVNYPNFAMWGNRCATKQKQYTWPLGNHAEFDSVVLCQNTMNSWEGGVLMVANGFTVEVYKHG